MPLFAGRQLKEGGGGEKTMYINKKPLRLETMALLKTVVACSYNHYRENMAISRKLHKLEYPPLLLSDILFARDVLLPILRRITALEAQDVFRLYMPHLLNYYIKWQNREVKAADGIAASSSDEEEIKSLNIAEKVEKSEQILLSHLPYIHVEPLIRQAKRLLEIRKWSVLNAIIGRIENNYIMVNNIMIIGAFYKRTDVVDLMISMGANDFFTSLKAAALRNDASAQMYFRRFMRQSHRMPNKYRGTREYSLYQGMMLRVQQSPGYTQFLCGEFVKNVLVEFDNFSDMGDLYEYVDDLDVNMCDWPYHNVFRAIVCMGAHEVRVVADRTL